MSAALAVQLVASAAGLAVLQDQSSSRAPAQPTALDRAEQVQVLLARRSAALLRRDRTGFLASVDPQAHAFRARQAALFDALREVPLASWSYELLAARERAPDPQVDRRHGARWWAPDVVLRYALAGFDAVPTREPHYPTFVSRQGRWYLAADDDFASRGFATARALWDLGPVAAHRAPTALVLAHPDLDAQLPQLAADAADAVTRVSRVWATGWARRVVVIAPRNEEAMRAVLGGPAEPGGVAAVATAQTTGSAGGPAVGQRILVNPRALRLLSPVGRRVVLAHEVTHVAARPATGPGAPQWVVEGFADYVAFRDLPVPVRASTTALRAELRAGRMPVGLPADAAFRGGQRAAAASYEQAWLAVRLLAETYGESAVLDFYRAVGALEEGADDRAVSRLFQSAFGASLDSFVARWLAHLRTLAA